MLISSLECHNALTWGTKLEKIWEQSKFNFRVIFFGLRQRMRAGTNRAIEWHVFQHSFIHSSTMQQRIAHRISIVCVSNTHTHTHTHTHTYISTYYFRLFVKCSRNLRGLRRWYIDASITILDINLCPVFHLIYNVSDSRICRCFQVSPDRRLNWIELSRFHLKTQMECSLRIWRPDEG
jgi:hypothetical protein